LPDLAAANGALAATATEETSRSWITASTAGELAVAESEAAG